MFLALLFICSEFVCWSKRLEKTEVLVFPVMWLHLLTGKQITQLATWSAEEYEVWLVGWRQHGSATYIQNSSLYYAMVCCKEPSCGWYLTGRTSRLPHSSARGGLGEQGRKPATYCRICKFNAVKFITFFLFNECRISLEANKSLGIRDVLLFLGADLPCCGW